MLRKPPATYTILARRFEENNESLRHFRMDVAKRGPFDPDNEEHTRLIKEKLKSFHTHDVAIGATDLKLLPMLMFAAAISFYSFSWAVCLVAVIGAFAVSQNRISNGRRQQSELKELIILHDWCTENGVKNLDNELVRKLATAVKPELRDPADYNIQTAEQLANSRIIQFFKDLNHALTVAIYGLPPSEYELPQIQPESAPEENDSGLLASAWSYVPSLRFN